MESIKVCPYCHENMIYGPQKQIRITTKVNDGVITKVKESYIEYGWRCNMTDDDCDVIFEKKIE